MAPIPHVGGGPVDDYQVTKLVKPEKKKMVRVQFRDEELNFFKFAKIVLNEFPKALRQTFKFMWNRNKFGPTQPRDNSEAVRKAFLAKGAAEQKFLQTNRTRSGIAPGCSRPLSMRSALLSTTGHFTICT